MVTSDSARRREERKRARITRAEESHDAMQKIRAERGKERRCTAEARIKLAAKKAALPTAPEELAAENKAKNEATNEAKDEAKNTEAREAADVDHLRIHVVPIVEIRNGFTIVVGRETTVRACKDTIQNTTRVPYHRLLIIMDGKQLLEDDRTLSAYNVQNNSTLRLHLREPEGQGSKVLQRKAMKRMMAVPHNHAVAQLFRTPRPPSGPTPAKSTVPAGVTPSSPQGRAKAALMNARAATLKAARAQTAAALAPPNAKTLCKSASKRQRQRKRRGAKQTDAAAAAKAATSAASKAVNAAPKVAATCSMLSVQATLGAMFAAAKAKAKAKAKAARVKAKKAKKAAAAAEAAALAAAEAAGTAAAAVKSAQPTPPIVAVMFAQVAEAKRESTGPKRQQARSAIRRSASIAKRTQSNCSAARARRKPERKVELAKTQFHRAIVRDEQVQARKDAALAREKQVQARKDAALARAAAAAKPAAAAPPAAASPAARHVRLRVLCFVSFCSFDEASSCVLCSRSPFCVLTWFTFACFFSCCTVTSACFFSCCRFTSRRVTLLHRSYRYRR